MPGGLALEHVGDPVVQRNFEEIQRALGALAQLDVFILDSGTPEAQVEASPPAVCFVRSGGSDTTVYVKVDDPGLNTGWEAVQTA